MEFRSHITNMTAGNAMLGLVAAAAMTFTMAVVSPVSAATYTKVGSFGGNGCTGGGPFATFPDSGFTQAEDTDGDSDLTGCSWLGSDWIVKYDFGDDGAISDTFLNPTYAGFNGLTITETEEGEGSWSYDPEPVDGHLIGIIGAYFKGGTSWTLYTFDEAFYGGAMVFDWIVGDEGPSGGGGLSNAVFFNTKKEVNGVIPLPAAGWLLLTGMGGLALLRRRKTA